MTQKVLFYFNFKAESTPPNKENSFNIISYKLNSFPITQDSSNEIMPKSLSTCVFLSL